MKLRRTIGAEPVDPDQDPSLRPRLEWDVVAAIAVGGSLGSMARWATGELLPHGTGHFPWSTFLINVVGSFILGGLTALVTGAWSSTRLVRPFWGVGVLGGFTTFSSWMLDSRALVSAGAFGGFGSYVAASLLLGIVAAWAGLVLGRRIS